MLAALSRKDIARRDRARGAPGPGGPARGRRGARPEELHLRAIDMKSRSLAAWGALLPLGLIVCVGYIGTVLWTLRTSVSSSRTFPKDDFVGLQQFERLLDNDRWQHAIHNLAVYGVLYIVAAMAIGF